MEKRPVHLCDCGEHAWLPLTRGFVSLVDPEYASACALFDWYAKGPCDLPYAARNHHGPKTQGQRISITVLLHHTVLPPSGGILIDHVNGNTLDNRRRNLRLATQRQNAANQKTRKGTSKYRGVSRAGNGWRAIIGVDGEQSYLGKFDTEEEAARAYDSAALERHGVFARINFPESVAA